MNWYQGNIAEAVAMSKTKNAIFVVYIEGKDELTQKLSGYINDAQIKTKLESDDFVAIKIESDSQAYMQFAKIYQMVPVPSIFFIGNSGTPIDIGTGIISSAAELEQKIVNVLTTAGKASNNAATASASLIAAEQSAAPTTSAAALQATEPQTTTSMPVKKAEENQEIVCEGGVCYKKPKEPETSNAQTPATNETANESAAETANESTNDADAAAAALSQRVEETRKLLEQKRRERVELEKQAEKEQELRRRQDGKEMQKVQSWQKEQELKDLKDSIKRERLEEQAARERIRAQIAGDRAERQQRLLMAETAATSTAASSASPPAAAAAVSNAQTTRLQFRLSTGDTKTHSFASADTLSVVRDYVKSDILPGTGLRDFILATTYPKREFAPEHDVQTLLELGLTPSAVILIIGKEGSSANPAAIIARSGGLFNMLTTVFWTMLSPVFAVFGYIRNFRRGPDEAAATGAQKRANEEQGVQQDAAKRRNLDRFMNGPSTSRDSPVAVGVDITPTVAAAVAETEASDAKAYRRFPGAGSNIHRLSDKRKDSDDENATWNGNSTQQQ